MTNNNYSWLKKQLDKMAESKGLRIQNRKYLGSKQRLLDFIEEVIVGNTDRIHTFIDGFAGTGVVANHFRPFAEKIIVNDLLYSNYVINRAFLGTSASNADPDKVGELIAELNSKAPHEGYAYQNYGGTYFTHINAGQIDAIRDTIDDYFRCGRCNLQEKFILLASLLFAADKVSNTVGQYDAFLKHLGSRSYDDNGTHRVDSNVYTRLKLKMPALLPGHNFEIYNEDLNKLINSLEGDVLYLDPPYNNRQYVDCYHLLENIATWNKPPLRGKTRKFDRAHLKSSYSKKQDCTTVMQELLTKAKAEHIFLSYNSEGIIPDGELEVILKKRGELKVYRKEYSIFGNGAGKSVKRPIEERIFHLRTMKKRLFQGELFEFEEADTDKADKTGPTGQNKNDKTELFDQNGTSRGFYSSRNRLNNLTGREWVYWSKSVITNPYPPDCQHKLRSRHGAQKPPGLCADLIRVFTKEGQMVLDPFSGVGGTLIGATIARRRAVGIELIPEWIKIYRRVCKLEGLTPQEIIEGDSSLKLEELAERKVEADFILTDVPYWQMDKVPKSKGKYKRVGKDGQDNRASKLTPFNNLNYSDKDEWLSEMEKIFIKAIRLLKKNRYLAVFIGDMYNNREYHFLTSDLAGMLSGLDLTLKANLIWYDGSKSLHIYGYLYEYIPSLIHQNILIFRKAN